MALVVESLGFATPAVPGINLTVPKPAGTAVGDLVLIFVGNDDSTATAQWDNVTLKPTGFTLIQVAGNATSDASCAAFWRIIDGSEGASWVVPAQSSDDYWGFAMRISGADPVNPINVIGSAVIDGTPPISISQVVTTVTNCLAFALFCYDGGDFGTFSTASSGWTIPTGGIQAGTGSGNAGGGLAQKTMGAAGGTGTCAISVTVSDGMAGFQFAVAPLSGPAVVSVTPSEFDLDEDVIDVAGAAFGATQGQVYISDAATLGGSANEVDISAAITSWGATAINLDLTQLTTELAVLSETLGPGARFLIVEPDAGGEASSAITVHRIKALTLSPSTNIAAGGANTTAQLTAPAGKSTGDFGGGRIQDDENPADAVDLGADEYGEWEWSIASTAGAVDGETYLFRVLIDGEVADTTTVVPSITLSSSDVTVVGKSLGLQWDAHTALGDQSVLRWDIFTPVADQIEIEWDQFTSVGDQVELEWDLRAAVGDPVALEWDILTDIGDPVSLEWDIHTFIGDEVSLEWDQFTLAGDPIQFLWDLRQAVGDPLELEWDVEGFVAKELDLLFDVSALAGKSVELEWDLTDLASKEVQFLWDLTFTIGDPVVFRWDIAALAGDDLGLEWDQFTVVGDPVIFRWDLTAPEAKDLSLEWDVAFALGDPVEFFWDIAFALGDPLVLRWDLRSLVGDPLDLQWDLTAPEGKDLALFWDILVPIADEIGFLWDQVVLAGDSIEVLWDVAFTLGDPITLRWDISSETTISKQALFLWDIQSLAGEDNDLVWDTWQVGGDEVNLVWEVQTVAGEEVAFLWDMDQTVGEDLGLEWDISRAVGDPLQLVWDVAGFVAKLLDLLWDVAGHTGKDLDLEWDLLIPSGDEIEVLWEIRGLAGQEVDLFWDLHAAISDQVEFLWDVLGAAGPIGKYLSLLWDLEVPFPGFKIDVYQMRAFETSLALEREFDINLFQEGAFKVSVQFTPNRRRFSQGESIRIRTLVSKPGTKVPTDPDSVMLQDLWHEDGTPGSFTPVPFTKTQVGDYHYLISAAVSAGMASGRWFLTIYYTSGSERSIERDQFVLVD